jgi:hypothetical protein
MKNKLLVPVLAAFSLVTLIVSCSKQETTATALPVEAVRAPDPVAGGLNAADAQKADEAQKAADAFSAATAQKEREATAQRQADADKADQAQKQAAAEELAAEQAAAAKQSELAAGAAKVQALISTAKSLSGENKWSEVLKILSELAGQQLTPAQQSTVDGLKSDAQKQAEAALVKKATADASSAIGGFLAPKK